MQATRLLIMHNWLKHKEQHFPMHVSLLQMNRTTIITYLVYNMSFVTDDKLDLLFDPKLIPDTVRNLVGSDLHVSVVDFFR